MDAVSYHVFTKEACEEVLRLWRNTEGICLHENGEDTVEGITYYLERNPGYSFIAKDNDKIIGALLCGHDGRRGFIHHLAVDKQYQKRKIGKTLLQMSIERLKKENIRKCILFVLKKNA
ncbi:MAG TPA: GNAT family N-acetyltransferase, partial [Firmicutes bacterium]|nr:GNAT family N-acetyltransferase [Bacillota bacterium]